MSTSEQLYILFRLMLRFAQMNKLLLNILLLILSGTKYKISRLHFLSAVCCVYYNNTVVAL